jgi:hypothetical protein
MIESSPCRVRPDLLKLLREVALKLFATSSEEPEAARWRFPKRGLLRRSEHASNARSKPFFT